MWIVRWNDKTSSLSSTDDVLNTIKSLHNTYLELDPIIVQIENPVGDLIMIGLGNSQYSIVNYYPINSNYSLFPKGEYTEDGTICFYMGDDESEFYIRDTIHYETAIKILECFLANGNIYKTIEWQRD